MGPISSWTQYTVAEQRAIDKRAAWIIRDVGVSQAVAYECAQTELDHGLLKVEPILKQP